MWREEAGRAASRAYVWASGLLKHAGMKPTARASIVAACLLAGPAACSSSPDGADAHEATGHQSSASSGLTRKLWILNEQGDARVGDFFDCILGGSSNFNDLANTYQFGESLSYGGQVQRNDDPCVSGVGSQGFFQCAVDAGHFDVSPWDVVLVVYPNSGGYGGQNDTMAVKNPVTGASVTINTAYVATSPNWIYQTIYGMHEVFEAATDGVSADCCDGETSTGGPFPWCADCGPWNGGNGVCGQYAPGGRNGSLGIATIQCPHGTYSYQQVSPANHEFDGTCKGLTLKNGPPNPCAGVSAANSGVYCGASREGGFSGGGASTLYTCSGGQTTGTASCPRGCFIAPAGQADGCVDNPCAHVSSANDGLYCGSSTESGFADGAPGTLYTCTNGQVSATQSCAKGCTVAPAGQADRCN
jgi:hypothetical protein